MTGNSLKPIALSAALQFCSKMADANADEVLAVAKKFNDFLGDAYVTAEVTAVPAPKPSKRSAAQAPTQAVEIIAAKPAASVVPITTAEQVYESIKALIIGQKRDAAAAILKKYGAADIKALKPTDYALVVADATAALTGETGDDLLG
jgi:murein L,D-transpeptidase YcbB/YkuD